MSRRRRRGHPARRSSLRCTWARCVFSPHRSLPLMGVRDTASQFHPIPPKPSMSDVLAPRSARSSSDAAFSLIAALSRPTTVMTYPPSPSTPVSRQTTQPSKAGEKTRSPSRPRRSTSSSPSIWTRCRWWWQSRAQVVHNVSKSCVLAADIASLFVIGDAGGGAMAMVAWALSMRVGLDMVDLLIDRSYTCTLLSLR